MDAQWKRIEAIIGGEARTFKSSVAAFYEHLLGALELPCEVTGIEDFNWEERYVFGVGDPEEYKRLKKKQPSYEDRYDLLAIEQGAYSEWMPIGDDIGALVKRKSDGKEFCLGLSELKAVGRKSPKKQLLDDFGLFFANSR